MDLQTRTEALFGPASRALKLFGPPMPSMVEIMRDVARTYGVTVEELRGPARRRTIAWPRQEIMWRCKQVKRRDGLDRYSTGMIGAFLGGRDHTTVMHGVRRHQQRLDAS